MVYLISCNVFFILNVGYDSTCELKKNGSYNKIALSILYATNVFSI